MLTHMHIVMFTWWCWHICEDGGIRAVKRGLGSSLHCAEGWKRRRSRGSVSRWETGVGRGVRRRQTRPPHMLPNPSCVVLVCEHQTHWWCYNRRMALASIGGGVSRAQRLRRRWAASDAEACNTPSVIVTKNLPCHHLHCKSSMIRLTILCIN
jgi:hypothetical protein